MGGNAVDERPGRSVEVHRPTGVDSLEAVEARVRLYNLAWYYTQCENPKAPPDPNPKVTFLAST